MVNWKLNEFEGLDFKAMAGEWRTFIWGIVSMGLLMSFSSCSATQEGDALQNMGKSWGLNLASWAGSDPCQNWLGVGCTQGSVTSINLSYIGLSGPIPPEIVILSNLTLLDLSNNNIMGPFPQELAALQYLQVFNVGRCNLNMPFPTQVLQLVNLVELRMDVSGISGPIPDGIKSLSKLRILYLGNNSLAGPLPAASLGSLVNLEQLTLWGSRFNSPLPPEFGSLIRLQYLNLHDCNLWGGLPESWGNMKGITIMLLYNNDLTGYFPSSWQSLTRLVKLRLNNNALSGAFPDWMKNMPLSQLDMSRNSFEGPFPLFNTSQPLVKAATTSISLFCNYFNGSFPLFEPFNVVNYSGNCFSNESSKDTDESRQFCNRQFLCRDFFARIQYGCAPCPSGNYIYDNLSICTCKSADYEGNSGNAKLFPYGAVIGGTVGSLAILVAVVALCKWDAVHKRLPFDPFSIFSIGGNEDDGWDIPEGVHRYTLAELGKATGNFDEAHEIGSGGFGKVFVGTLMDGKMVAIKRASMTSFHGQSEFRNEVTLLSRLHHRHLVRLEGFCDEEDLQILVYEYMKNGNLNDWILQTKEGKILDWYKRLEIAVGIAQGLDYLHSFADPPVIHRDIKPSNILLDEFLIAKVADFGISRETPEFITHISTRPAGTAGYLDPEYFLRRHLTTASDVYGFGVLVLEIITGQQAIDHNRKEEYNLIEWARPRFREGGVETIVDPALEGDYNNEVFTDMTNTAFMCASFSKNDRPAMKDVVSYLEPHLRTFQASSSGNTETSSTSSRSGGLGLDGEPLIRRTLLGTPRIKARVGTDHSQTSVSSLSIDKSTSPSLRLLPR